jgi:sterol desaturase/sphingolipid hydroxylase (fatty acid hydroxylase superfamily)
MWLAESVFPFFVRGAGRAQHDARNMALGAVNGLVRAAFFPAALLAIATFGEERHLGAMRWIGAPGWAAAGAAVLLLDLMNYAWHIASHRWRFLWRFHIVHHHDAAVDASTALRFHAGDVFFNMLVVLAVAAVLGLRVEHVLLYEAILLPLSIFHHANLALPERWDRVLRAVIVTPRMHWVHHSRWREETDSNFSGIFSFWDRLFGTFRVGVDPGTLDLGLDGYSSAIHGTLRGCLLTPFGPVASERGHAPERVVEMPSAALSVEGAAARPPADSSSRQPSLPTSNEDPDASGHSPPLASPSTHPSRGRHLPLALAVYFHTRAPGRARPGAVSRTPAALSRGSARGAAGPPRTLRPCPTPPPPPRAAAATG